MKYNLCKCLVVDNGSIRVSSVWSIDLLTSANIEKRRFKTFCFCSGTNCLAFLRCQDILNDTTDLVLIVRGFRTRYRCDSLNKRRRAVQTVMEGVNWGILIDRGWKHLVNQVFPGRSIMNYIQSIILRINIRFHIMVASKCFVHDSFSVALE